MISRKYSPRVAVVVLGIFLTIPVAQLNAQQLVISDPAVKSAVDSSKKIGEFKGSAYYFKSSGVSGVGQIFRVSSDTGKLTMVGIINANAYNIMPAEKSDFFALVTDTPASAIAGGAAPTHAVANQPPTPQNASTKQEQPIAYEGTAVKKDDGTVEVKLQNGDVVDFLPGAHMLLMSNGSKKVEVTYDGVTSGQTAGKKVENGISSVAKIGIGGLTRGRAGSIDPQNYTIVEHTANGELTFDTSILSDGKPGGGATGGTSGTVGSPDVAELLGAFDDAVNQNVLQKSYLPARHKLDRVAGIRQ